MLSACMARLPLVGLRRPWAALGRSTVEGLHSGLHHGHAGAIRELVGKIRREAFRASPAVVLGTGGHAARFRGEGLFDAVDPDLVLRGLLGVLGPVHDRR